MPLLLPLKLIGIGTENVESLSSYVERFSHLHGVTVGHFLSFLYENCVPESGHRAEFHRVTNLNDLSRSNKSTLALMESLEVGTGDNQHAFGTFLALRNVVIGKDWFEKKRKWCAGCMRESYDSGGPGYYRLLWQLKAVKFCSVHAQVLRHECGNCGSHQDTKGFRTVSSSCQTCQLPLGVNLKSSRLPDLRLLGASRDLEQLVAAFPFCDAKKISNDGLYVSVKKFLDWCIQSDAIAFYEGVFSTHDWILRQAELSPFFLERLPMTRVREVALAIRAPLIDVLAGLPNGYNYSFNVIHERKVRVDRETRSRVRREHAMVRKEILKLTATTDGPLSLRAIARRVGVSTGYIRYRFPELAEAISSKRAKYLRKRKDDQFRQALGYVMALLADKRRPATEKSRKKTLQTVLEGTGLPKNTARWAVGVAFGDEERVGTLGKS